MGDDDVEGVDDGVCGRCMVVWLVACSFAGRTVGVRGVLWGILTVGCYVVGSCFGWWWWCWRAGTGSHRYFWLGFPVGIGDRVMLYWGWRF